MRITLILSFTLLLTIGPAVSLAESPDSGPIKVNRLKIVAAMLSDAQLWTDRRILGGYRIQHRPGADQWRLLDASESVIVKGTRLVCETRLAKIAQQESLTPPQGEIVVLAHGLFQTRATMESLERQLSAAGGLQVVSFGYASTQAGIDEHAEALREVLSTCKPEDRVSFVGHSMGCIVMRKLLAEPKGRVWRVGRVVMIGPPNQGAEMARRLLGIDPIRRGLGPGFEELARPNALAGLPAPPCEFAVIAGTSPPWMLNNPLIAGDDDWIVGIHETTLDGAKCSACFGAHHGRIVHDRAAIESTIEFLKHGRFPSHEHAPANSQTTKASP